MTVDVLLRVRVPWLRAKSLAEGLIPGKKTPGFGGVCRDVLSAAYGHDCICCGSISHIPSDSIPVIPVDEDSLLFRSNVNLKDDVRAGCEHSALMQSR